MWMLNIWGMVIFSMAAIALILDTRTVTECYLALRTGGMVEPQYIGWAVIRIAVASIMMYLSFVLATHMF